MARNFSDLQKSKTPRALNLFCEQIAREYAESDVFQAETHFTEMYNITSRCYRKAKEYAVTHYLVSDHIVDQMEAKSKENRARNCYYSKGKTTTTYYARLRRERKEYCISIMKEYEAGLFSVEEFIRINGIIDPHVFFEIVKEALSTQAEFPFSVVKEIQIRMIKECESETDMVWMCNFFSQIWTKRK